MNKKIIALLVVVALATTGVFAMGLGVMSSAQTGWGAISYAPSKTGMYYGLGWGAHGIGISAEIPFVNGTFFDADLFSLGYRVGAGINTWLNFIGGFGFGVGVYGFAGLNFNFDLLKQEIVTLKNENKLNKKILFAFDKKLIISNTEYQELLDLCKEHKIYILDINNNFNYENANIINFYKDINNHPEYLMVDNIHLTKEGNIALANFIINNLNTD